MSNRSDSLLDGVWPCSAIVRPSCRL